ncbi:MAG: fibronectin type III domain-containing protein [Candidatus Krumholzibacteriota bacterium]
MKPIIIFSSIFLLCLLSGCSDSDSDNGTTPKPVPAVPTGLSITDTGVASIALSWNASDNATEYLLFRSDNASANFAQVYSGDLTEFVDTGLGYFTTYYYKVSAANSTGESGLSDVANGLTDEPEGFTVTGSPQGSVDYTFNYVGDFNGKPRYQSDPIGLNIIVPSGGDQAGQWCINDQIEQMNVFYHPLISDYPSPTGWRAVNGDTETTILLTPF